MKDLKQDRRQTILKQQLSKKVDTSHRIQKSHQNIEASHQSTDTFQNYNHTSQRAGILHLLSDPFQLGSVIYLYFYFYITSPIVVSICAEIGTGLAGGGALSWV